MLAPWRRGAGGLAWALALLGSVTGAVAGPRTNVILILADDLGYGDLGSYGQRLISTPELDRLAADGARFTQFYSASPHCHPARSALLTGLHTGHTWVRRNEPLADAVPVFPQALAAAGYRTAVFGKWGMARVADGRVTEGRPQRLGFASFVGFLTHRDAHAAFLDGVTEARGAWPIARHLFRLSRVAIVPERLEPRRYVQDELLEEALAFLEDARDGPFLLYLPWTLPHPELALPDTASPTVESGEEDVLARYLAADGTSRFEEVAWRGDSIYGRPNPRPRATYAAMVSRLDRDVGRIARKLRELGIAERTLLLFTSDNGPHDEGGIDLRPGDDTLDTPFASTGGLRGLKRSLYEGGIRVPLIAWWPGTVPAGLVVEGEAALWDLAVTIAAATGVDFGRDGDGVDLLPALRGQRGNTPRELYWETHNAVFQGQAVRRGRWKLVRRGVEAETDPVQLFDLRLDPGETRDVAEEAEHCLLVNELQRSLAREHRTPVWLERGERYRIPPLVPRACPAPPPAAPVERLAGACSLSQPGGPVLD